MALAHWHIEAENGALSAECAEHGIISFLSLLEWIEQLPYGRNSNRSEFSLIFHEFKGTCSTKHALVKAIANENNWPSVQLYLGIYLMSADTNPGVETILSQYGLSHIPEAHTYLKIDGELVDLTGLPKGKNSFINTIQTEEEITPNQIGEYKLNYHKKYISQWVKKHTFSERKLWEARENCIKILTKNG